MIDTISEFRFLQRVPLFNSISHLHLRSFWQWKGSGSCFIITWFRFRVSSKIGGLGPYTVPKGVYGQPGEVAGALKPLFMAAEMTATACTGNNMEILNPWGQGSMWTLFSNVKSDCDFYFIFTIYYLNGGSHDSQESRMNCFEGREFRQWATWTCTYVSVFVYMCIFFDERICNFHEVKIKAPCNKGVSIQRDSELWLSIIISLTLKRIFCYTVYLGYNFVYYLSQHIIGLCFNLEPGKMYV